MTKINGCDEVHGPMHMKETEDNKCHNWKMTSQKPIYDFSRHVALIQTEMLT